MSDYENEAITDCGPPWRWNVIWETLQTDTQSPAFDPELRREFTRAYDAVIEASKQAA